MPAILATPEIISEIGAEVGLALKILMTFEMTRDEFANEFVSRVWAAVDDLAGAGAHTARSPGCGDAELYRLRSPSMDCAVLGGSLTEDVDGMVADVLARFRAKRNDLEKLEVGSA